MPVFKIRENIFSIGVLNPGMRVFDIIMRTDFGTSYNAFAVSGADRTVLIDTVHERFADEYFANLDELLGSRRPDALIIQHCEPDHTGTVEQLLRRYPGIEVLTTQAGAVNIKKITNDPSINLRVVADGETYDLGGERLRFISAPFLHWPDTMFTYDAARRVVFTCDFLGCHYCEPAVYDAAIKYPGAYEEAFHNYYIGVLSPFKKYVIAGLDKLDALDFDAVCPSHGPVLTGGRIAAAGAKYREWSAPAPVEAKSSVCVFYCSAYGYTKMLAERIADGIKESAQYGVELYDLNETPPQHAAARINECGAFLIGSPTLNRDAVGPIWALLASVDGINSRNRPCAAFGSFGWSGEAVPNIEARLAGLKCKVFSQNLKVQFRPSGAELEAAEKFGQDFAAWLGEGK